MDNETCTHCGIAERLHYDGVCPQLNQGLADPPSMDLFKGLAGQTFKVTGPPAVVDAPPRKGWRKVDGKWEAVGTVDETRRPLRRDAPERTVTQCKEAALRLLNRQLWTLEGVAESDGLTGFEEERLLALLRGFNSALPKTAEEAPPKPLSEMSDEELALYERKGKK